MIWTHYGRWSNDGLVVYNNDGRIIYRLPHGFDQGAVLVSAIPVGLRSFRDPSEDRRRSPVQE